MNALAAALVRWAGETPHGIALSEADEQLTWSKLRDRVADCSARLVATGARSGSTVALRLRDGALDVIWMYAVWHTGAAVMPLHAAATSAEVEDACRRGQTDVLVDSRSGTVSPLGPADSRMEAGAPSNVPGAREGGGPTPAAVIWTSGTSGQSRGVVLSDTNLTASARAAAERLTLSQEDRWLLSLSPAHVGGLAMVARACVLGCTLVHPGPPGRAVAFLLEQASSGEPVTHASLVPTSLRSAVAGQSAAPSGLRAVLVGGAAADPVLVADALRLGWPVALTYGLTEAASQVATATPDETAEDPRQCGSPLPGVLVRSGHDGAIEVAGPTVAMGVRSGDPLSMTPDRWLRTRDLGELDERGRLRIHGRVGTRIITGGVNVDPQEVEAALNALPGVAESVVFGLPDAHWGERVVACIVPDEGFDGPTPEALRAELRARLAGPKVPKEIRVVDGLARNRNGKLDRELQRRAWLERSEGP